MWTGLKMRSQFLTSARRSGFALGRLRCQNECSFVFPMKPIANFQRLRHTYNTASKNGKPLASHDSNGLPLTDLEKAIELIESFATQKGRQLVTRDDLEITFKEMLRHYMRSCELKLSSKLRMILQGLDPKSKRPSSDRLCGNFEHLAPDLHTSANADRPNPWLLALVYENFQVAANEDGISAAERETRRSMASLWRQSCIKGAGISVKPTEEQMNWMNNNISMYIRRGQQQMLLRVLPRPFVKLLVFQRDTLKINGFVLWVGLPLAVLSIWFFISNLKPTRVEAETHKSVPGRVRGELPSQAAERLGRDPRSDSGNG